MSARIIFKDRLLFLCLPAGAMVAHQTLDLAVPGSNPGPAATISLGPLTKESFRPPALAPLEEYTDAPPLEFARATTPHYHPPRLVPSPVAKSLLHPPAN